MAESKIEWMERTWNPISPGRAAMGNADCEGLAPRGENGKTYLLTGEFRELPDRLDVPLRRKKPTTYFVNSMSDLFGEGVSDEFIAAVFGIMDYCEDHRFQLLTKRADRLVGWFDWIANGAENHSAGASRACGECLRSVADMTSRKTRERLAGAGYSMWAKAAHWPLRNVHVGVSVENRKHGLPRIDELRKVPAAVRFLSIEPLLEDLGTLDLTGIHWVIVGGESGAGTFLRNGRRVPIARPTHPVWVRSIRDQCTAAGVPFFFKQWGHYEYDPRTFGSETEWINKAKGWIGGTKAQLIDVAGVRCFNGGDMARAQYPVAIGYPVGKGKSGRILDGRTWDEVPR